MTILLGDDRAVGIAGLLKPIPGETMEKPRITIAASGVEPATLLVYGFFGYSLSPGKPGSQVTLARLHTRTLLNGRP
jgi:hypothetical protein